MKRLILLALMALPIGAMASIPEFTALVERYTDNDQVTTMSIDKDMLTIIAQEQDDLKDINDMAIILTEESSLGEKIITATKKIANDLNAESIVSVDSASDDIAVYTLKDGNNITHIIMTISTEGQMGAIVISGNIPVEKIDELIHVQM